MAIYVVEIKLPFERRASLFGVLHSTSDTMFSPTFGEDDELIAQMFAFEYSRPGHLFRDYTESGQTRLAADLRAFLEERFPNFREPIADLPAEWRAALPNPNGDAWPFTFDSLDVVAWFRDGDARADVIADLFHAWRRAAQRAVRI